MNCGLTYEAAESMPIPKRRYWIRETHRKKEAQKGQGPQDGKRVIKQGR